MNRVETKNNIEALLDGELDDRQKDAIEHHLWICPPCLELKERMSSFSILLQTRVISAPTAELDERVIKSFKEHHASKSSWRSTVFGVFVVPKPVFATLLILAVAASWLAFQVGKISSTTISMIAPSVDVNENQAPVVETKIRTITVEVPVITEKTVTRIIYVREPKNTKNEKVKSVVSRQNNTLQYSSTVADNSFFTDVSLKGFEPSAEVRAKIIKEVKENEK